MAADAVTSTTGAVSDAINQRDVKSHAVRSIKTISINRVAVMPLVPATPAVGETLASGGAEAITAELYGQVAVAGGWEPIPEQDVDEAMQSCRRPRRSTSTKTRSSSAMTFPPTA